MKRALALLALMSLLAAVGFAFDFQPITQDFAGEGPGRMRSFRVANSGSAPIAVRVRILSRSQRPDGEEIRREVGDEFVLFPSRLVLDPGESQLLRVQWRGGPVEVEQAYRVIAEQLPVDFAEDNDEGSNLNILFRYVASAYVVPENVAPDVQVEGATVVAEAEGPYLDFSLRNAGTGHTILKDLRLSLSRGGAEGSAGGSGGAEILTLGPEDLPGLAGTNLLAGATRRASVALPDDWPTGPVELSVDFDETR